MNSPEVARLVARIEAAQDSMDHTQASHAEPNNDENESTNIEEPLIPRSPADTLVALNIRREAELSKATSRISSLGIAVGCASGIMLLLLVLIPVTKLHGSTFSLRLAIGISGIWWAVFTIPAALWLPGGAAAIDSTAVPVDAEGDPIPLDDGPYSAIEGKWNTRREIGASWKRLGGMLRWSEIKKLRNTFRYLAAWFLLSDGKQ